MVTMIPPYPRAGANRSEQSIFSALEGILDRPEWIVIHSLDLAQNFGALMGESDFIVLAPGKGVLVIEAKSPKFVEYKAGDWYMDKLPQPHKSPLKQLDGARRSIRGFLAQRKLLGDEPFARMLWMTSIARHQFENKTPGDMQFFEWELAWQDDIRKPTRIVEKALNEYFAWFSSIDGVTLDRDAFTPERAKEMAAALVGDFKAHQTREDEKRTLRRQERTLLDEQLALLDMVETNPHIYFDGSAGTGKSFVLAEAARRLGKKGMRTLVTCWNVLMADELRRQVMRPEVEVQDLNSLMLSLCGLSENPAGADKEWYETTLPTQALAQLKAKPHLASFEAICVDEFQDIAANPLLLELLLALAGTGSARGTVFVLAGDESQQILRASGERVHALDEARSVIPDLLHLKLRTNCRTGPQLSGKLQRALRIDLGLTGHRISTSVPSDLEVVRVEVGAETSALAAALRELLLRFDPDDVRILSPFGNSSLVASLLARPEKSQDERWLRKHLAAPDGSGGKVRWHSIFKFKGLESDAVIITDVNPAAVAFADTHALNLPDMMYVGMTRAKYHCVVLDSAGVLV